MHHSVQEIEDKYSAFIQRLHNEIAATYNSNIVDVNQFLVKQGLENRKILAPWLIICINFFQEKYKLSFRSRRVSKIKYYSIDKYSLWLNVLNSLINDSSIFKSSIPSENSREHFFVLKNYLEQELNSWKNKRGGNIKLVYANLRPFIYDLLVKSDQAEFKKEIKDEEFVINFIYHFFSKYKFDNYGKEIDNSKTGRISDEKSQKENIKKFYVRKALAERDLFKHINVSMQKYLKTDNKEIQFELSTRIKLLQNQIYSHLQFPFPSKP